MKENEVNSTFFKALTVIESDLTLDRRDQMSVYAHVGVILLFT